MLYVNIGGLVFVDLISHKDDSDVILVWLILSLTAVKSESGSFFYLRQSFLSIYHKPLFFLCVISTFSVAQTNVYITWLSILKYY